MVVMTAAWKVLSGDVVKVDAMVELTVLLMVARLVATTVDLKVEMLV